MAASRIDIERWFDEGKNDGSTHMLIVTDTYDWDDYPVYVDPGDDVKAVVAEYEGKDMQKVTEVYALHLDKAMQMAEFRAFHCDAAPA